MKKKLSGQQVSLIQSKSSEARQAWLKGNLGDAERLIMEAWKVLPLPPTDYDYAQILSRGIVTFFRDTKQFDKAIEWLDIIREAYSGGSNDSVNFLAGTVYFEAGDFDKAFSVFDALFKKFKQRPFQGEKPEYLAFYQKELKGKG